MNNQQIKEKLKEDGWKREEFENTFWKNKKFRFTFHDFEKHEIEEYDGRDLYTRFLGIIRSETQYKAIMSMLNIK